MTYQLDQITVSRAGNLVLDRVCLTLERGRLTGLIGPNGAGKSTLLSVMAGDLKVDQGQVLMDNQSLAGLSVDGLAHKRSVMSQQAAAIFNLTVKQVLMLGLHAFSHWPVQAREAIVVQIAQSIEITPWLDRSMIALSIGQQQRVHFARALLQTKVTRKEHGAAWLLLDEPTASQDPWQQQMIMSACRDLVVDGEVGVLLVMHDLTLTAQWCDDLIVLKDHGVLAQGPTPEVLTPGLLKRTYGQSLDVQVLWDPAPGVIMSRR